MTFYPSVWTLLRDSDIPFRLHWGKHQPAYQRGVRTWIDFFRARYIPAGTTSCACAPSATRLERWRTTTALWVAVHETGAVGERDGLHAVA